MRGIAGVFRANEPQAVENMLDHIKHRGPDGWRTRELPQATLGQRRLAILDVEGGSQPLCMGKNWIASDEWILPSMGSSCSL
jgi:asparagine synthase (glutamine-hydrolysing)